MANTISPLFTDEELISNLRTFFEYEEMYDFNFVNILGSVVERSDDYFLFFRGKSFSIDKITGAVEEVWNV